MDPWQSFPQGGVRDYILAGALYDPLGNAVSTSLKPTDRTVSIMMLVSRSFWRSQ